MTVDIAVLRQQLQGLDAAGYATALESRLPDAEIRVARTPAEERALLASATVAAGTIIDAEALEAAESLELFACTYSGTEHLPLEALADHDIRVTNASGVHGPNIAEYVIGGILAFARGFPKAWRQAERREWRSFETHELQGSTVTVIGMGAIGQAVLDRLEPFGVHTIGLRYSPEKGGSADEIGGFDGESFDDALARSQYVVVATPLTDSTEGLIDAEALSTMPPEAVLVNIARGSIVETDALIRELQRNGIRGAVLDVTDPEPLPQDHVLWGLDNVLLSPHHAGFTPNYWERRADLLAANFERAQETGSYDDLENQVQ